MAYCDKCGAYVPDGHSKCLACGYDRQQAEKEAREAAESAAARSYAKEERCFNSDFLKQELEKQRRRQQENSRKWAENEKSRRKNSAGKSYSASGRSSDNKRYSAPAGLDASKLFSMLSYFGILFVLPYIFRDKDKFAVYHANQGMKLFIVCLIGEVIGSIFGLGWLVNLGRLYFIYKGIVAVLNSRMEPLPYIGTLF